MAKGTLYRVSFINKGEVYEVYAKEIFQSDLYGFIEIEDLVFGNRAQMLVDPSEEKLKTEFEGVTRSYVPTHAVIRIDEVESVGTAKISPVQGNGNVAPFPGVPPKAPKPMS